MKGLAQHGWGALDDDAGGLEGGDLGVGSSASSGDNGT